MRDFDAGEHVEVRAVSLDDWCREARVSRWDAMKLDAEGSELAVLEGAKNSIEQFHPVMMIEINGILLAQAGISSAQVAEFLAARKYRLFDLSYGQLQSWSAAKHGQFSDTLCLPEAKLDAALERLAHAGFDLSD